MEANQLRRIPRRFIGQVRYRGARLWTTVTGKCCSGENALNWAVQRMGTEDVQARALVIDSLGSHSDRPVLIAGR